MSNKSLDNFKCSLKFIIIVTIIINYAETLTSKYVRLLCFKMLLIIIIQKKKFNVNQFSQFPLFIYIWIYIKNYKTFFANANTRLVINLVKLINFNCGMIIHKPWSTFVSHANLPNLNRQTRFLWDSAFAERNFLIIVSMLSQLYVTIWVLLLSKHMTFFYVFKTFLIVRVIMELVLERR